MTSEPPTVGHRYRFSWAMPDEEPAVDMDIIVLHATPDGSLIRMFFVNVQTNESGSWLMHPDIWKERWERVA